MVTTEASPHSIYKDVKYSIKYDQHTTPHMGFLKSISLSGRMM